MFCFAILSVVRRLLVTGMTKIISKSANVFSVETGKSSVTFVIGKELGTNSHTFTKSWMHIFSSDTFCFYRTTAWSIVKISSMVFLHRSPNFNVKIEPKDDDVHSDQRILFI